MKRFLYATLNGYSAILFSDRKMAGLVLLAATFFNWQAGLMGLIAVVAANATAILLGANQSKIEKGLYAFNALLVGSSFSLFNQINIALIILLLVAIVLLFFVTLGTDYIFGYYLGLPVLSLPFVFVSFGCYFAFYNYPNFQVAGLHTFFADPWFPHQSVLVLFYFKSLAAIFFQSSPWAGVLIALVLFSFSRLAVVLSVTSYLIGIAFHFYLGGSDADLSTGVLGFNSILTAIAIGGVFLVPSWHSFALGLTASIISVLTASFLKIFLVNFSIPVMAMPFCLVTLLVLFGVRLLHNPRLPTVDFLPGSPEQNIDYFKTRLQRFGLEGIEIRLPFSGKWIVSQGYHGEHTHTGLWAESLDFMAVDEKGELRRGANNELDDYYCYGLPVLACAGGTVIKIVNHIADNPIGEMDVQQNWGNLVLIQHGPLLFSHVSHLQPGSVTVQEGDYVVAGDKLGLVGNSGRSPEPHLHLHFQSTPEIGSPTRRVSFSQYVKHNGQRRIRFNQIPAEGEVISTLEGDFALANFFRLAPGMQFQLQLAQKGQLRDEKWQVGIDFTGSRFIENDTGDKLFYYQASDYFAGLNYRGSRSSALFWFFMATYRIPFDRQDYTLSDPVSHRFFSSRIMQMYRGMLLPFTDSVLWKWYAAVSHTENGISLESFVSLQESGRQPFQVLLELQPAFPGKLIVKRQNETITITGIA
ncbi:MAG: urea transporter [Leptospiraceae bacterium]|nr:urea transporter [Leptospiraceae bacterium]